MQVAAFENEPDAAATAVMLREQGYDTQVVTRSDQSYDERMRAFFGGKPLPLETHAFVITDADGEPFVRAVQRHYGHVIRGELG